MDKAASSVGLWLMRSSSEHVTFLAQQVVANCKVFNVIEGDLGLRCKRM